MKSLGVWIALIGAAIAVYALNMDTSVSSELGPVNNVGLMSDRQDYLIFGGVAVLAGILIAAFNRGGAAQPKAFVDPFDEMDRHSDEARMRDAIALGVTRVGGVYHFGEMPFPNFDAAFAAAREAAGIDRVDTPERAPAAPSEGMNEWRAVAAVAVIVILIVFIALRAMAKS